MLDFWIKDAVSYSGEDLAVGQVATELCCPAHWLDKISEVRFSEDQVSLEMASSSMHVYFYFSSAVGRQAYITKYYEPVKVSE